MLQVQENKGFMHKIRAKIKGFKITAIILSVIVLLFDQFTKYIAVNNLLYTKPYPIIGVVSDKLNFGANWFLTFNYGTAFSVIQKASDNMFVVLLLMSIAITAFLFYWLLNEHEDNKLNIIAVSFIIGGALGNIYDRIAQGYVIDFIDVYAGRWHWPVFNLADMAISLGVILLIWHLLFDKSSEAN